MKAKLYTQGEQMEVRVSNKSYASTEGENKKTFLKRVKSLLEVDFDEAIDIVEISVEQLLKLDDTLVTEAYKASKSGSLQETILKGILNDRNIDVTKVEKTSKKKVEKVDKEVAQATEEYINAKAQVGKLASYTPTGTEDVVKGIVKSVSLNKTNTIIYFNISSDGKLRCCTSKNETLEFFEI